MEITDAQIRMVIEFGGKAIGVLVLLLAAWMISTWVSRMVSRNLERARVDLTLSRFLSKTARWLILVLSLLTCLSLFGIQTTSFAAVIGAAGLAVGLAFQGTLANFSSGVMLLIFRPFKVGDVITVGGETGKVYETAIFSTTLDTADNRRIILPNGNIFGTTIENITYHDTRRVDVSVGVDYTADIDRVREVLTEVAAGVPGRLDDPPAQIILSDLGASSVDWTVRIWSATDDYWAVREEALESIKKRLDIAGIGIPYPQMDVHLDKGLS
jgi:small conductance mechanosensitive channel